ncbi:MAG TPA: AAA family ATPase [Kofleriaceae bacterium]|jgi:predicted ATPase
MLLETLRADGLLSFAPGSPEIPLRPLNVIIGPNGSGKSNLIEIIELLRATPTGLAAAIRDGGGVREWLWKGKGSAVGRLEARLHRAGQGSLRYRLSFAAAGARTEIVDESIEEAEKTRPDGEDLEFYYRFSGGDAVLQARPPSLNDRGSLDEAVWHRRVTLRRETLAADESILSQRKEPELYPELSWCATQFSRIQTLREWSFGRYTALRQPQPADLPTDVLLPDARNLGLFLHELEQGDAGPELNAMLRRFLPRFKRVGTRLEGNTVQVLLHEDGLTGPVPATRLSDGTLRFLAMTALLLVPRPPPLICIEEPELGLHPDAMLLIAELLVAASARTQLVVTTHSDALVSALTEHVDSVLVCDHRGGTELTRLDADRLRHWLEQYRLGDVWRMGELGGNP